MNKPFILFYLLGVIILCSTGYAGESRITNTQQSGPPYAYTWNTTVGLYTASNSWVPSRSSTRSDDVLIFDGSITGLSVVTALGIPSQTIGQLIIINGSKTNFTATNSVALTMSSSGLAFLVDSTSCFQFASSGSGVSGYIILNLPVQSKATIYGEIVNGGQGFNPLSNQLFANSNCGIIFCSGASYGNSPGVSSLFPPFGSSSAGGIVFQSGATYYQSGKKSSYGNNAAGDPFNGVRGISSPVVFQPGSLFYSYLFNNVTLDGNTFGNITFDQRASGSTLGGASPIYIQNTCIISSSATQPIVIGSNSEISIGEDLIIQSGSAGLKDSHVSGSGTQFKVKGNFTALGSFIPSTSVNRFYVLDGSTIQTITLSSTLLPNLTVDNSAGIVLGSHVSVSSCLRMTRGNITPGSYNLTLGINTIRAGVLNRTAGTILGNFIRWISPTPAAYTFPVGTISSLNEASINFTTEPSVGGTLTCHFIVSNPGSNGLPLVDEVLSLFTVNPTGYWSISTGNGLRGGTYDITLQTNGFSFIASTSEARIVKRTNSASVWTLSGNAGTNNGVTITRTGINSGFSEFGIAESILPPTADFIVDCNSGYGPLTVNFTDNSLHEQGSSTIWYWDFGDGDFSILQNPQHIYGTVSAPTTYNVRLVVTTHYGIDTSTEIINITEPVPTQPNFISPVDSLTTNNHTITFSWTTSVDSGTAPLGYTLQVGLDSSFISLMTTIQGISSTSYMLSEAQNGWNYWKVAAINPFGQSGYFGFRRLLKYDTTDQHIVRSHDTVTFYLGDSTDYLPLTISFQSIDTDTVSITLFDTQAEDLPTPNYITRYWKFDRTNDTPLLADLTFTYSPADFADCSLNLETDLFPAHYSSWWSSIPNGITRDCSCHTLTVSGVSEFSTWTLGGLDGVPIHLSLFSSD